MTRADLPPSAQVLHAGPTGRVLVASVPGGYVVAVLHPRDPARDSFSEPCALEREAHTRARQILVAYGVEYVAPEGLR